MNLWKRSTVYSINLIFGSDLCSLRIMYLTKVLFILHANFTSRFMIAVSYKRLVFVKIDMVKPVSRTYTYGLNSFIKNTVCFSGVQSQLFIWTSVSASYVSFTICTWRLTNMIMVAKSVQIKPTGFWQQPITNILRLCSDDNLWT